MNTYLLTKSVKTPNTRLVSQLETIQEDLPRFSGYVSELLDLPCEQLKTLKMEDPIEEIFRCLKRFEARCIANSILTDEIGFVQFIGDVSERKLPNSIGDWYTVRREARRANKLASQLSETITKIRAGLSENQNVSVIPEDILQIKQTFGNVVNDFGSDDLLLHG